MSGQGYAYSKAPLNTPPPPYGSHQADPVLVYLSDDPSDDPLPNTSSLVSAETNQSSDPTVTKSAKPRKPCKPRKKQAVKATNRAATKAIVKKNVSESVLLKAPLEVRDNILRILLGDSLIHIQYFEEQVQNADTVPAYSGLCSAFCVAEESEQEAYDEANLSSGKVREYIPSCKDRHENCLMSGPKQEKIPVTAERLTFTANLSVLAVCRLLYEESNNVLWQTNTFSFDDSLSFTKFFSSMNASQKYKLRKLHISMDMVIEADGPLCWGWRTAIAPRVLTPLKNLKIVHLSFEQLCYNNGHPRLPNAAPQVHAKTIMDTFLGLRALPWKDEHDVNRGKHVTVIISHVACVKAEHHRPRWTKAQKLETAETLRASLAAPNSAEIHAVVKAAAKVAKKAELQCFKRIQIRECIREIDGFPLKLEKAKEEVEKRRADADRSESKLTDFIRAGKAEQSVERMEKYSLYCGRLADKAEARLESQTSYFAVLKARLIKFQANFKDADGEDSSGTMVQAEKA